VCASGSTANIVLDLSRRQVKQIRVTSSMCILCSMTCHLSKLDRQEQRIPPALDSLSITQQESTEAAGQHEGLSFGK
jgi:hypothetical protein